MRERVRRVGAGWSAEAAIFAFATLLAFGTLGYAKALHAFVLDPEPTNGGSHFVRDGLLLLPLALGAICCGLRAPRLLVAGPRAAAVRTAAAFALLLAPAAAAHTLLDGADVRGVAQAGAAVEMGGSAAAGAALEMGGPASAGETHGEETQGLASALLHGAWDALLILPAAFLLALVAFALLRLRGERKNLTAPRRRFAVIVTAIVVAGAAAIVPASSAVSPDFARFSMPLKIPPALTGQNIQIEMAESQQQILPTGPPTTMWTYNGSYPGPTIRRPTGVPTNVTFKNNLPDSAGSMSVHHHGAETSESNDGHPSKYLVAPGASKTYTYPAFDNGVPERAAPQWYHDHRDKVTGRNVWMGLAGLFIYDDPFEQALNLPKGEYDVPLMVTDRQFGSDNQLMYQFTSNNGIFGDVILVNGVPQPFYEVGDRRYRFRLYNTSNKRDYRFRLSNGQPMTQIGTGSGLLPEPVSRTEILLGPAERADVVVDFSGRMGQEIVLQNAAGFDPNERDAEVMQFRVTQDVDDSSSPVPSALRPLPATGAPVVTRTWNFDRTDGKWTINGRQFDPNRVDAAPELGTTERWVFRNPSNQVHLVHVHLGDQKLVSRNGRPPPALEERLKETWYLAPGEEVVVDMKFGGQPGTFVLHCHVLEHEDDAMMTQFQTLPAASGPSAPQPGAPTSTTPPAAVSAKIKILSSKRLGRILRRGLRFEAGVPNTGVNLRATLSVGGRTLGTLRRTALSRGRVRLTLKLSRRGKARARKLMAHRRRVRAVLKVSAGNATARARFTIVR